MIGCWVYGSFYTLKWHEISKMEWYEWRPKGVVNVVNLLVLRFLLRQQILIKTIIYTLSIHIKTFNYYLPQGKPTFLLETITIQSQSLQLIHFINWFKFVFLRKKRKKKQRIKINWIKVMTFDNEFFVWKNKIKLKLCIN